jgi:hypothetical protein
VSRRPVTAVFILFLRRLSPPQSSTIDINNIWSAISHTLWYPDDLRKGVLTHALGAKSPEGGLRDRYSAIIGVLLGSFAGYCSGWIDAYLASVDMMLSIPAFFSYREWPSSNRNIIISIVIGHKLDGTGPPGSRRCSVKEREFVLAARAISSGQSDHAPPYPAERPADSRSTHNGHQRIWSVALGFRVSAFNAYAQRESSFIGKDNIEIAWCFCVSGPCHPVTVLGYNLLGRRS